MTGGSGTLSGRLLGLDYGDRTVGVAVSDPMGMGATGVEIIYRKRPTKLRSTLSRIGELIDQYDACGLVLGWPLNIDGTEGIRCERTGEFGRALEQRFSLPVIYWDERLTTVEAYDIMKEAGIHRSSQKNYVDEVAAIVILQDYLENGLKHYGTDQIYGYSNR